MEKKQRTEGYVECTLQEQQKLMFSMLQEIDRICRILGIGYVLFAGTALGAVRHGGFIPWDDDLDIMMLREDYDRFLREADGLLDREKFFLQKEFSEHWPMFTSKLRANGTTCLEKYHPKDAASHQGVFVDIFPCDNAFDSGVGKKIQFYASKVVIAKSLYARGYDTDSGKKRAFMSLCRALPMKPFLHITKGPRKRGNDVHSFLGGASNFRKNVYPRSYFEDTTLVPFEAGMFPVAADYDGLLSTLYGDYMTLPPPEERVCKQHSYLVDLHRSYEVYEHARDNVKFDVYTRSIR